MSIAWATVVLVVLLLPGFCFFWGFYAPNQVTRESVPASPLGQLAGVVIFGFFVHGLAYWLINRQLCAPAWGPPCIDFDEIAALVRIDGTMPAGRPPLSLDAMLDRSAGWVLLYFLATAGASFGLGVLTGRLVARGTLPLTRHRYLFQLEEARRQQDAPGGAPPVRLVRAHVLSRTAHDGLVIIYDGILRDFFAKADGTISYLVLRTPRSGTLKIEDGKAARSGHTDALLTGEEDEAQAFLVITSEDIANVYFEPLLPVIKSDAGHQRLEEELQRLERETLVPPEP